MKYKCLCPKFNALEVLFDKTSPVFFKDGVASIGSRFQGMAHEDAIASLRSCLLKNKRKTIPLGSITQVFQSENDFEISCRHIAFDKSLFQSNFVEAQPCVTL